MWTAVFIVSFLLVLIGFGQAETGKLWGKVLYFASLLPLGLALYHFLKEWMRQL